MAKAFPDWNWDSASAPWFQHAIKQRLTPEDGQNLLNVLKLTSSCKYTDPRDKVFGVLGLNTSTPAIRPDYSLSEKEVIIGIFVHCLISLQDTRVLSWASGCSSLGKYLPWIPSWSVMAVENVESSILELERSHVRQANLDWQDSGNRYQCVLLDEIVESKNRRDIVSTKYRVAKYLPFSLHFARWNVDIPEKTPPNETLWPTLISFFSRTGGLLVPLIHLLKIPYKPRLVGKRAGLASFLISALSTSVQSKSKLDSARPDFAPWNVSILLIVRCVEGQSLELFKGDHLFMLDRASPPGAFLILRKTAASCVFSVVIPYEQILFIKSTH